MEVIMANWRTAGCGAAFLSILFIFTLLINGCAGGQTLQQEVTTEYLLTTAGFQRWDVNDTTPKWQALVNNIPKRTIVTYKRNGEIYHAYTDEKSLYIGDQAAYRRYVVLAGDRKLCQRVSGVNQVEFWSCMQDFDLGKAGPSGK
jgi:hypothetical protein